MLEPAEPGCFLRYCITGSAGGLYAAAASHCFKMVLQLTAGHGYWAPVAAATRGFEASKHLCRR